VSLAILPARVRTYLYVFWAGTAVAGLGVVGFVLSFWQVGSADQATIDVHYAVPVLAYASILAWITGLALMWYGRRRVDAAVAARLKENRAAAIAGLGLAVEGAAGAESTAVTDESTTAAPDRRDD